MNFCSKGRTCTQLCGCGLTLTNVLQSIARVPHQTTDFNAARQQDYHSQRLLVTLHEHPSEHAQAEGNVLPGAVELKEVRPCTSVPPPPPPPASSCVHSSTFEHRLQSLTRSHAACLWSCRGMVVSGLMERSIHRDQQLSACTV